MIGEYKISELITLRLIDDETKIFVNNREFSQCKHLVLSVPINKSQDYNSIDELESDFRFNGAKIDPKTEFIGHCSNLQAWYEHDYDTKLLHKNLAFPLLRKLALAGDKKANKYFKEEVVRRIESGYIPVIEYLIREHYLITFTIEELVMIEPLLEGKDCSTNYKMFLYYYFHSNINKYYSKEEREGYLEDVIERATGKMWGCIITSKLFKHLSLSTLVNNEESILNKLTDKFDRLNFKRDLKKRKNLERKLDLDNVLYFDSFKDGTAQFKHSLNIVIARMFKQVNRKVIHSIKFIANSKKDCKECSNKAGYNIVFITESKFYSLYYCEVCVLKVINEIMEGFENIKQEILKLG